MSILNEMVAKPTILPKTEQEKIAYHIRNVATYNEVVYKNDMKCWDYFNNTVSISDFEYLTKIGNYDLPAKLRHIPLQRNMLNLLISQQVRRPFVFSISAVDETSANNRYYRIVKNYVDLMLKSADAQAANTVMQRTQLESQLSQIQQQLQQEPQDAEQAKQLEAAKQQFPLISMQLNTIIKSFKEQELLDQITVQKQERYHRYTDKELKEELAQKVSLTLRQQLDIQRKSNQNFVSHVVSGKQFYYVDYLEGQKYPIFEPIDHFKVYYPKIDNVEWVQDGPWGAIEDKISFEQLQIMYADDIKKKYGEDKIKEIQNTYGYSSSSTFVSTSGYGAMYMNNTSEAYYPGINDPSNNIKRLRIWFKVPRMVRIKKSLNKYEQGAYFRHFVDDEKVLIDQDEYKFQNGYYIYKNNKTKTYKKEDVETFSTKKGDEIITRYISDVYEAVIIGDDLIAVLDRKRFVVMNTDNYTITKLPIVGPSFSSRTKQPYSLIKATIDLQDLYNILHYHEELMLALAGAKGNVIDVSQKPKHLTQDEWEYQMKLGRVYIQTADENGHATGNSFNQWQAIDNSLSASVQYIMKMKEMVSDTMGNIIGVPRPRQGQVVNTDQVGTFNAANEQASLITEIVYNDHDEIERQALAQLLNLSVRYCFNEEQVLNLINPDSGISTYKIPKGIFTDSFFDVLVANNNKEESSLKELKQITFQNYQKGLVPFSQILDFYRTESLTELYKKVEYFTNMSEEIQRQQQQAGPEQQIMIEQKKIQFTKEYDMAIEKLKQQTEMMKLKLEEAKLTLEQEKFKSEIEFKYSQDNNKSQLKATEIQNERDIEGAYLGSQDKNLNFQNQLEAIKVQLSAIQLDIQKKQGEDSHLEGMTKITSDHYLKKGQNKEKIKD